MRIVSLVPSATELVCRLGLDRELVGVSADSDWPAEVVQQRPVLNTVALDPSRLSSAEIDAQAGAGHRGSSLYHVDPERLAAAQPDLILTQETCEVCAVSRRDVELATRTLGYAPSILSLNAVTLDDVLDDVRRLATAAGVPERGTALAQSLRDRLEAVRARAAGLPRPSVFCMEWLDPPYSAGHWVPQMVELAGGCDALGTPAGPSRKLDWQEVTAYAPEALVLIPCSLGLDRIAAEFGVLRRLRGWDHLPAVQRGQVFAGNTQLFSRAGPRLVDGVELLARLLHPETFRQPIPGQALKLAADGQALEACA